MPDIVTLYKEDQNYPLLLGQISDPPAVLYCRGNLALLNTFCIGVVGTRKASDYGQQACRDIAGTLASNGITIVSGLAIGIDAIAHHAALENHGNTIAVLGTGIENLWPKENEHLGYRIIDEGGLVISEYPDTTPGAPYTFPTRNRIISGLSRGVLVVEADKKSGSLITAKSALHQDRDVFAVPGSIYWPRSVGSNWLIQQGARPVMNAADLLECYTLRQIPLPETAVSTTDPTQQRILTLLHDEGPTRLDVIVDKAGGDPSHIMAALSLLELRDIVVHQGAGVYKII